VEPLETVDLNNDLVRLSEQEQEEQERVLRGWSEALRYRHDEVLLAVDGLAEMDGLQARALFAEACSCIRPEVAPAGPLGLGSVRHPLLDRRLRGEGSGAVPLSLGLDPSDQVLVVSGPNTGGKTVAIKTLGLAVLMAQSGVPVPAVEARLPLYRQLRTDIGDRQSIEDDLSTYSAHIRAVVDCLREAAPPALFLFDEIGGGTDPAEGAALAQAILEELQRPGMTTVATTHQGALKAWAFTTEGAVSAAMEFDTATLRPTYQILMGAAGVSAGLEIAERLGLPPRVVARARGGLGEDARRSEDYLSRLRELTADLERQLGEADRRARELSDAREGLEARAKRERARGRRGVEKALDGALEEFRAKARKELAAIRDKREKRRAEKDLARAERALRMERERRADEVVPAASSGEADGWLPPEQLREGMEVYVHSLARPGRVQRIRGDRVEVQLGKVAFTVRRSDLRVRHGAGGGDAAPAGRRTVRKPGLRPRKAEPGPVSEEAPGEIKLLGMTVDEALPALDKFLDAAALAGHQEIRVIHGHGTGRLREAVRRFLRSHVHAAEQRPGRSGEGGDGATVVVLK
jgi:DNA mismatch repair protein MutS2